MLSVLLSVLLLGPITIIRLTDEFPSICGQLGLTATDPSKSQKERTRMLGLVVSCVVVLYSSWLVRGWNEMSKGQISWFLLCFYSFSLVVLIVIGIYLVPDKGLLVIHYFVSLLSLWLTHIFFYDLWTMVSLQLTFIEYFYILQVYRQAEKKVARKRRILVNYSPKKSDSMSAQKQCVIIFAKCQVDVFFVRIETSSSLLSLVQWSWTFNQLCLFVCHNSKELFYSVEMTQEMLLFLVSIESPTKLDWSTKHERSWYTSSS